MVDERRVLRLLAGIETDVAFLAGLRTRDPADLAADPVALRGLKYAFVTAIEGCAKVAHHIAAAEGWPPAETNGDAVRALGRAGIIGQELAASLGDAVAFRNLLVHGYADVDDRLAVSHLDHLSELQDFVSALARWLRDAPEST